jgi:type III secretion system FlhB-like substrate exporter
MKTLIKLIIAAVLVNAAYRSGTVFLKYYQFKDETQQMVLFGQGATVSDLTSQIVEEAMKRDVPLDDDGVMVSREGTRTVAEVAYTDNVELFPSFIYPVNFSFSAEAYGVPGAGAAPARPKPR